MPLWHSPHPSHPLLLSFFISFSFFSDLVRLEDPRPALLTTTKSLLNRTANGALVGELLADHAAGGERAADCFADLADCAGFCLRGGLG